MLGAAVTALACKQSKKRRKARMGARAHFRNKNFSGSHREARSIAKVKTSKKANSSKQKIHQVWQT
jgi:hypothetical protein